MNTSNKNSKFDVVIVGAGVAGAACALEISARGQAVAVLSSGNTVAGTESISPNASKRLEALGVIIGSPLHETTAWWGSARISRMPCQGAKIIQREDLALQMRTKLEKSGIEIFPLYSGLNFAKSETGWYVEFLGRNRERVILKSHFLVDASGRGSVLGRAMKAERHYVDKLCCLSTSVPGLVAPGTWTESVADGWWNLCSNEIRGTLAFYSTPAILKSKKAHILELFSTTNEIKRISNFVFGQGTKIRVCSSTILRPCAGPGWFAVGDAAMTFQPLASAGVAKALRDSKVVIAALNGDHREYVTRYETEFEQYAKSLTQQYANEYRWPQSNFWKATGRNT